MALNKNYISILIAAFLSIMMSVSCGSDVQKSDGAFEQVKKDRMMYKDSDFVGEEIIQVPEKIDDAKKNDYQDIWLKYKIIMESKIRKNENKIKELRALPDTKSNLLRKVNSLEIENNELRVKIDEYIEDDKMKWEMFKVTMNHNANQVDIELNSLKISNK